jgi:hypothetical protein
MERHQFHSHAASAVYYLTDCNTRSRAPDGKGRENVNKAGTARVLGADCIALDGELRPIRLQDHVRAEVRSRNLADQHGEVLDLLDIRSGMHPSV